ncbi:MULTISPECIES: zinc ribbon domain-containing protein [unclassified Carboxydocella]|uniref:double zinc ribbon domain-containing protein n=1 Tax=Carboxydocella TaxID=178898 RepID=UPI00131C756F
MAGSIDTCEKCGKPVREEWNYCPFCKHQPVLTRCPHCLKKVKLRWQYCPFCRANIKGNRTTATINAEANAWLRAILESTVATK